jgi:hypothetical protein
MTMVRLHDGVSGRWRRALGVFLGVLLAPACGAADSAADEQLLRQAQLAADGPSLLNYFRQRTVAANDRQRIERLIRQLGDPAYAVRERASAELIACGLPAVSLLRQAAADPDVEVARRAERCLAQIERVPSSAVSAAAARLVARQKPDGAAAVLLAFLPAADDEGVADEVREALAAVALRGEAADPVVVAALADPSPVKRAAAAEALIRTRRPAVVADARKALTDADADVRLRTALALVTHAKDKEAVTPMINMLADLPQGSGWRVEELLIRLAGDASPRVSLGGDAAARAKCRDAWLAWWEKNGESVDLAKLDGTPALLGHTLIVLRDPRGGGRVVEINGQREELWRIDGILQPMDAAMSGRDRVLIADHNSHVVTERDLSGKEAWRKQVMMPTALQRLPNGHTLVVSRNQVVEWDERQREVFAYHRATQDIAAAAKGRNGEVVLVTQSGTCVRVDPTTRREIGSFATRRTYGYGAVEVLPNGHILMTHQDRVAEYDANGRPHWEAMFTRPSSVQRLPNGNTLVCGSPSPPVGNQTLPFVAELDRNGKTVWEYRPPENMMAWKARRR